MMLPTATQPAQLLANNAKWAEQVKATKPDFFPVSTRGQAPKFLWIGCADSRVPESVITGCEPGDIFVHRNVANQFQPDDNSANAILQYAVENVLCDHIIVAGHSNCGGALACLDGARNRLPISPTSVLATFLSPLLSLAKELGLGNESKHPAHSGKLDAEGRIMDGALDLLVEENVRVQVGNVVRSPTMQSAWEAGKDVTVHGWVYKLHDGKIKDLKVSYGLKEFKDHQAKEARK